jgi:hypothetical protein
MRKRLISGARENAPHIRCRGHYITHNLFKAKAFNSKELLHMKYVTQGVNKRDEHDQHKLLHGIISQISTWMHEQI